MDRKLIKHILKEETEITVNEKRYLDKVVSLLLNDIYVSDVDSVLVSFGSIGEAWDQNLFHDETEEIVHKDENFNLLGWDYYFDEEDDYDEGYYFRINKPDEHYDFDEFQMEVMYDWFDSLVMAGRLGYDDNMGDHGEWYLINYDLIVRSRNIPFTCTLWRNELENRYEMSNCSNPTNRIGLMRELIEKYSVSKSEHLNYSIDKFYSELPSKILSFGVDLKIEGQTNISEGVVDDFIDFGKDTLSLDDDFTINLVDNGGDLETLANYDIENGEINVLTKNRAIPDIIRSIAHEMVHHKQNNRGELTGKPEEGEDGSPWEDEANAKAGELVRIFGRQYPEIYDL
jgi:hypothetical protein